MADTFDLDSKIGRAIYALILGTGVGTVEDVYVGNVKSDGRTLPNTTILSGEGYEEDLQPGNFRYNGMITFRDDCSEQTNDPNPNSKFLAAQQRVSAIIAQLVQSDDQTTMDYTRRQLNAFGRALAVDPTNGGNAAAAVGAANNLDMVDFTLIYWKMTNYGKSPEKVGGLYFERVVEFECVACNSNID